MNSRKPVSPAQIRAGRGLLGWSQGDLCRRAGVSRPTLSDFEAGKRELIPATNEMFKQALEAEGVIFMENAMGHGVMILDGYADNIQKKFQAAPSPRLDAAEGKPPGKSQCGGSGRHVRRSHRSYPGSG